MSETYNIKWKAFPDQLVGAFKDLGEEANFYDVTLVSDDQIQIKAHKIVLSACSPVLKTMLVNNPHSHPLLYLRGIKQTELQAILQFMYFGETKVNENRINMFISVAKDLEVKDINEKQGGIENKLQENLVANEKMQEEDNFDDEQKVKAETINSDDNDCDDNIKIHDETPAQEVNSELYELNSTECSLDKPHYCKKCGWIGQGII